MKMKKNITFILFARNEEKRIEFAIKNLINYGYVYVLDGGSTDGTRAISEKLGAKFFIRPKNKDIVETEEMLEFIKKIVKTNWIYWGFVDNLAPRKTLEKFVEISNQSAIKHVFVQVYTYLCGNTENIITKTDSSLFFMKDFMDFSNGKIHKMGRFIGKESEILHLPNTKEYAIRHYSLYDLNKFISNHLNYAEIEAKQYFRDGKKFSLIYLIGHPIKYFYMYYKTAFKNGVYGLIISLLYASFRLMVYAKLYELENKITLESMEEKYARDKRELLNEFNL